MRVTVFGATGGTGQHLVRKALPRAITSPPSCGTPPAWITPTTLDSNR